MNAADLMAEAVADGLAFSVSATGALQVKEGREALQHWLPAIRQEKEAILAMLRADQRFADQGQWRAYFDATVAASRTKAGMSGERAARNAYACCIAEWLDRTFEGSAEGLCALLGDCRHPHSRLVPYGLEETGYVWLHPECRPLWAARRKLEAVSALAAAGVTDPAKFAEDFGKKGSV